MSVENPIALIKKVKIYYMKKLTYSIFQEFIDYVKSDPDNNELKVWVYVRKTVGLYSVEVLYTKFVMGILGG
jgi:hypothetical protein